METELHLSLPHPLLGEEERAGEGGVGWKAEKKKKKRATTKGQDKKKKREHTYTLQNTNTQATLLGSTKTIGIRTQL